MDKMCLKFVDLEKYTNFLCFYCSTFMFSFERSLVWTESDWNHLVKLMLSTKAPIEEWQDLLDNAPKETQELWGFPFQQHLVNIVAKNFGATAAENLLTKLFLDEQQ